MGTIFILGEKMSEYKEKKTVAVSGGMDPIHIGHVRMILDAAKDGDVIVILNSDDWLKEKKGYAFMDKNEIVPKL